MSYTEYKTVVRAKLDELNGLDKGKVYEYFKNRIGKAYEVDEYDGEIDYFYYKDDKDKFCPVFDYRKKQWGVDYVIAHSNAYDGEPDYVDMTIQELRNYCNLLAERFGVSEESCRLVNYSWYNGGDEPISL